jgi:hypothetical protein
MLSNRSLMIALLGAAALIYGPTMARKLDLFGGPPQGIGSAAADPLLHASRPERPWRRPPRTNPVPSQYSSYSQYW